MPIFAALKNLFKLKEKEEVEEINSTTYQPPVSEDQKLIYQAAEKADSILAEAEQEGIKIASNAKLGKEAFEKEYNQKLQQAFSSAISEYQNFLINLKDQSSKTQQDVENQIKTRVNEILLNLEQNLSTFLTSSQQQSLEAINLELKSARSLIDNYKAQQLALIDENIVAVLERTLSLVMRNKLSLSDQLDLVYEALEKAKVEKFFL